MLLGTLVTTFVVLDLAMRLGEIAIIIYYVVIGGDGLLGENEILTN